MATKSLKFETCFILMWCVCIGGIYGQLFPEEEGGEKRLKCFQCTSLVDKDCANILPNDHSDKYNFLRPCFDDDKYNGSIPFCRKIVQRIFPREDLVVVIRKCGWVRHPRLDCYNVRNEDHIESSCQCFEDGCNHSSSFHKQGPVLLLVFIALASYLYH